MIRVPLQAWHYGPAGDRRGALRAFLRCEGWQIKRWGSRRSVSWPLWRTIYLRDTADLDTPEGVALLAHETAHVIQWGRPWWRRWGRLLRYVADPWFRRAVEVEGYAHAVCVREDLGVESAWGPRGPLARYLVPRRASAEADIRARAAELRAGR